LPPVADLQVGQLISNQYVVERVVGAMGACVHVKVRHARLGQRFQLKHLSSEAARKPDASQRFLDGARGAMRLGGDHIARTVDAGHLPSGLPYVVSEAFQGSELREVLRVRGALTPTEAVDFMLQAGEAVAEAHRHGLSHGSLSPSTLFVTRRSDGMPIVKVLDFGISETLRGDPLGVKQRSWEQGTAVFWESSRLWDTLAYSAPEQVRGGDATPLSDVWALGATLYELLIGAAPFQAQSATSLLAAIVADPPNELGARGSTLSRGLEGVVLRCLSKEPGSRYPSVADLAAELAPFASPDAQLTVDRIARIQSYDAHRVPLSNSNRAIVRVGPSPARPAPAPTPPPLPPATAERPARVIHPLVLLLLTALGVLAGTVTGAFVAKNALLRSDTPRTALNATVAAAKPTTVVAPPPSAAALVAPTKPLVRPKAAGPKPAPSASPEPAPAPSPKPDDLFDKMW
jgi:serine/threonine-protein kinase